MEFELKLRPLQLRMASSPNKRGGIHVNAQPFNVATYRLASRTVVKGLLVENARLRRQATRRPGVWSAVAAVLAARLKEPAADDTPGSSLLR